MKKKTQEEDRRRDDEEEEKKKSKKTNKVLEGIRSGPRSCWVWPRGVSARKSGADVESSFRPSGHGMLRVQSDRYDLQQHAKASGQGMEYQVTTSKPHSLCSLCSLCRLSAFPPFRSASLRTLVISLMLQTPFLVQRVRDGMGRARRCHDQAWAFGKHPEGCDTEKFGDPKAAHRHQLEAPARGGAERPQCASKPQRDAFSFLSLLRRTTTRREAKHALCMLSRHLLLVLSVCGFL